jgi:antitoxin FitA
MTNVQIRDVPEGVVANLKKRAASRGQSLQGYLRDLLVAEAGVMRNSRLLAEAAADLDGLPDADEDASEIIRRGRVERDRALGIEQ